MRVGRSRRSDRRGVRPRAILLAMLLATATLHGQQPAQQIERITRELDDPDDPNAPKVVCVIQFAVRDVTDQSVADRNTVRDTFLDALDGSDDMRKKVAAVCKVWRAIGGFMIRVHRDNPRVHGAESHGGTLPEIDVDLGDLSQVGRFTSGDAGLQKEYGDSMLVGTLAHEIEHLKDGRNQTAHRDPEGDCRDTTTGPAVDDENLVRSQLGFTLTRTNYGGGPSGTTTFSGPEGKELIFRTQEFLNAITQLPPRRRTSGPPQGPPGPQGPPAPQGPQGPPAPPRRLFSGLDGIPEAPCGNAAGACYPLPARGDRDLDGVHDTADNCPAAANAQQGDANGNGIGDACDRTVPRCSAGWSFTDPKVYGSIGGAVLGGFLIAAGGDSPTATNLTPTGSPAPNPNPAPAPAPAPAPMPTPEPAPPAPPPPPPRTTADGRYRCVAVRVVSDEGRHNSTINLGPQLTGDFDVREGQGTITIRHPQPFVDIVNAQFDTATGTFSGTAVGAVAGSPNVGVSAQGTANTTSGTIVFTYTMGTLGELPGGRPIVYEITLQRQ